MNYLLNILRRVVATFQQPVEPYLLLADRPLHQTGVVIRKCYADELRYHFGFDYAEEPNYLSVTEIINDPQPIAKKICERLQQPLHRQLMLCPINPDVGYGVFTQAPLATGTLIGIYTGIITPSRLGDTDYLLVLPQLPEASSYSIDAKTEGGISRFLQHLPKDTKSTLDDEVMNNAKLRTAIEAAHVATANIDYQFVTINQKSLCCFVSNQTIEAGEQLGISYGLDYWLSRKVQPCYFNKNGEVVTID